MKFKNEIDKIQFELLGLNEAIIRNKLGFLSKVVKNKRKSLDMKTKWRRDYYKMKKAINKWHQSTQGKRFHRNLGNFLATHLTFKDLHGVSKKDVKSESKEIIDIDYDDIIRAFLGLNTIKTHLIIELQYYESDIEALEEFLYLFYEFINDSYKIENELLNSIESGVVDKEIIEKLNDIFLFFIDKKYLVYAFREKNGLSNDKNIDESVLEDIGMIEKDNFLEYLLNKYGE